MLCLHWGTLISNADAPDSMISLYNRMQNHVTLRETVILAIQGCAVGMGDASRGRYVGMLWETSSDLGVTIAHVTLLIFVYCSTFCSPWCIKSTFKSSALEIRCCLSSPFTSFQKSSITGNCGAKNRLKLEKFLQKKAQCPWTVGVSRYKWGRQKRWVKKRIEREDDNEEREEEPPYLSSVRLVVIMKIWKSVRQHQLMMVQGSPDTALTVSFIQEQFRSNLTWSDGRWWSLMVAELLQGR